MNSNINLCLKELSLALRAIKFKCAQDEMQLAMEVETEEVVPLRRVKLLKVVHRLPLYPPSEEMKTANDSNFSTISLFENNTKIIKKFLIDSKLDKNNIHFVYKMLLEMEDLTCMSQYVPLVQKDVFVYSTGTDREYWINLVDCPNIEDVVTPLIDEVVLVSKSEINISNSVPLKFKTDILLHEADSKTYRVASVRKINKDRVYFRFSKEKKEVPLSSNTKYDVIFRSRRYPLRYQRHALELLAPNPEIREYLFPTENSCDRSVCLPQSELILFNNTIASNVEQLMAVKALSRGQNLHAPFVIFGPPGTGKTTVIVESILQLRFQYPESRILVTAGSNSACDTIALRLCKYFRKIEHAKLKKSDSDDQKFMLRIYSKSIVYKGIKSIDSELLEHTNLASGRQYYPSIQEIHQYGIIIATLCTVGKLVTCDVGQNNFFTHIFIDEAGASTVPEALVGVMGIKSSKNCRLILSGDHKQLGPVLNSESAAQLGLEKSLMEHLLGLKCYAVDDNHNYDHTLQARLRRNYRSHPEIVRLYNHLYYSNELIAEAKTDVNMAANWCHLPNSKFPIIFQAVHGVAEKDNTSPSSLNEMEVGVVIWFLRRLLIDGINGEKVNQTDIGVITPYKLQNKRIQDRLNGRGWRNVECGSVETFQGREKEIIIVSLVRSFSSLGFLANPKRLNVLLSRPKSLLILVGNPLTLSRNSDFAFVLGECEKHGTFLRRDR